MLVKNIGQELAIRLGDPVENPTSAGNVFSSDQKLKYISRAYSKLTRLLKILMRDYQPAFNKTRMIEEFPFRSAIQDSIDVQDAQEIEEVFIHYRVKGTTDTKIAVTSYMEPTKYLSYKYDINNLKETSFADGKFKHTVMSNLTTGARLIMLPKPTTDNFYVKAEIIYRPDLIDITWDSSLPITSQYVDLLIDLAAIQGMQDIARSDKAQLIERSIQADWQILGQYGTYMKQTEGVKE